MRNTEVHNPPTHKSLISAECRRKLESLEQRGSSAPGAAKAAERLETVNFSLGDFRRRCTVYARIYYASGRDSGTVRQGQIRVGDPRGVHCRKIPQTLKISFLGQGIFTFG